MSVAPVSVGEVPRTREPVPVPEASVKTGVVVVFATDISEFADVTDVTVPEPLPEGVVYVPLAFRKVVVPPPVVRVTPFTICQAGRVTVPVNVGEAIGALRLVLPSIFSNAVKMVSPLDTEPAPETNPVSACPMITEFGSADHTAFVPFHSRNAPVIDEPVRAFKAFCLVDCPVPPFAMETAPTRSEAPRPLRYEFVPSERTYQPAVCEPVRAVRADDCVVCPVPPFAIVSVPVVAERGIFDNVLELQEIVLLVTVCTAVVPTTCWAILAGS